MKTYEPLGRRQFLRLTAAGLATSFLPSLARARPSSTTRIRAVAFDGFAIFDPRPIVEAANGLFPGRGVDLVTEWRTRQFEYTWLRTIAGHYTDFWQVTKDALAFAAKKLGLSVNPSQVEQLMQGFLELKPWPDVVPALTRLKMQGLPLAILANLTPEMMHACLAHSAMQGIFQSLLSTDQVQAFKPDPRAYAMGTAAFNLQREEILFVPSAGWDAAGSKLFGYPTYWVNRLRQPEEELGTAADVVAADLNGMDGFIRDRA